MAILLFLLLNGFVFGISVSLAQTDIAPGVALEGIDPIYVKVDDGTHATELTEYNADSPPTLVFAKNFKGEDCQFASQPCRAGSRFPLKVPTPMRPTEFRLSFKLEGQIHARTVHLLTQDFPRFRFSGHSEFRDLPIVFAIADPDQPCQLIVASPEGELKFYRYLHNVCIDFRPHIYGESTVYSYLEQSEPYVDGVALLGTQVVLDDKFRTVARYEGGFDNHEFLIFGRDHYMGLQFRLGRLPTGQLYIDRRIREYVGGKAVFDWGVSDLLKQVPLPIFSGQFFSEYRGNLVLELVHINSVQRLENGDWVVGLGESGVGYLNRKTRKLDWILGGPFDEFGLNYGQMPLFEHTAWFDPMTHHVVLYSNRDEGAPYGVGIFKSRVLEYEIDPKKKKLKRFHVVRDAGEMVPAMGSVQKLGESAYSVSFGDNFAPYFGHSIHGRKIYAEMKDGKDVFSITVGERYQVIYRMYRGPMGER